MRLQPLTALAGHCPQHFVVKKLTGAGLDQGRILFFQVHLALAQGMDRDGWSLSDQPEEASLQFAPADQTSSPQITEESHLASLSRDERVVDVEQGGERGRRDGRGGSDERGMEVVIAVHGIGFIGEQSTANLTEQAVD